MQVEMQKTKENIGWRQKGRTESESNGVVQTYMGTVDDNPAEEQLGKDDLLERSLCPDNLRKAYKQVVGNKGAGGVDKMGTSELLPYLNLHLSELIEKIKSGKYKPTAVRRVEIPKDNGKKRQLGIPTVVDRFIQQAISQVLMEEYEPLFSPNSFGFRPNRSAQDAIQRVQQYAEEGYRYCVDLDLERFFDTVNHSKLIQVLSERIKDGRVVSLVHKYLNAGVMVIHKYEETTEGVPQGGPLSPILSNVILNELDKELERRGHSFVRYADDCIVLVKFLRATERVRDSIANYVEKKLFLKVNKEKTVIGTLAGKKFLGYSFY